jgi:hypothetical protein
MPPGVFEPTISAGERPKTYALGRKATGTGLPPMVQHRITIKPANLLLIIRLNVNFQQYSF